MAAENNPAYFQAIVNMFLSDGEQYPYNSQAEKEVLVRLTPMISQTPVITLDIEALTTNVARWAQEREVAESIMKLPHGDWGMVTWHADDGKTTWRKAIVANGRGGKVEVDSTNEMPAREMMLNRLVSHDVYDARHEADNIRLDLANGKAMSDRKFAIGQVFKDLKSNDGTKFSTATISKIDNGSVTLLGVVRGSSNRYNITISLAALAQRTLESLQNSKQASKTVTGMDDLFGESYLNSQPAVDSTLAVASIPQWFTDLPAKGLPITEAQRLPGGYARVGYAIATEAFQAIKQNQMLAGGQFYAYMMPANENKNGVVRLVHEDQTPQSPWKLLNGEGLRIGMMTKEQTISKLEGWLRREPVIGNDMPQPAVENKSPAVEPSEFQHAGYTIYPSSFRSEPNKTVWILQTQDNKARSKVGMGDTIHATPEKAKAEAEFQQKFEQQRVETRAKADAEAAFVEAKREVNRSLSITERKANSVLAKDVKINGKISTMREAVQELMAKGAELSTDEVDAIKPMTRRQFNRADGREQDAHDKRVKEGGKKTLYYVGNFDLGKTAYDYAMSLACVQQALPGNLVSAGMYSGMVLSIADGIATQKINRKGETVMHALGNLSASVKTGEIVDIKYQNGCGQVHGKARGIER